MLPAIYDAFPDAAMEALASGLPVITSDQTGAAELVSENDAGFVCASRDVGALAAHMQALFEPELARAPRRQRTARDAAADARRR